MLPPLNSLISACARYKVKQLRHALRHSGISSVQWCGSLLHISTAARKQLDYCYNSSVGERYKGEQQKEEYLGKYFSVM